MEMHLRLTHFFEQRGLNKKAKLLLACSGGLDSMVLFHLLKEHAFHVDLAHCNFNLRGTESDKDEAFVKSIAQAYNVNVHIKQFDTKAYAQRKGISIQMSARDLRYAFFESLRKKYGYEYVLTAHHLNDSFETFLINLGRGSGARGLSGIPAQTENILRPLYEASRSEIKAYAKAHHIKWREDASNKEVKYQRNAIRHEVLPHLLAVSNNYEKGFKKSMQHLADMQRFATHEVQRQLERLITKRNQALYCKRTALKKHPAFTYILYEWLTAYAAFDLDAILEAIEQPNGQYFSAGDYELLIQHDQLILRKTRALISAKFIEQEQKSLSWNNGRLQFKKVSKDDLTPELLNNPSNACLDYGKLSFPLTVRTWREGDRFTPFGMKGSKKLSDFFTDLQLNHFEKMAVPLLISGEDIAWVGGFRINDKLKLTNSTKTVYFVRLIK
jgi:tRNA(Ile)-lysidine synthase